MDTLQTVLKSAKSFFAGTVLSRITGLLRDMAMAISFGSSPEIAAFMVAYRLANLFRRLLGEGNLQAGFVPHFASLKEEGGHFFRDTVYSMATVLLGVIVLLEGILWGLKSFVTSDWILIIDLTMWMVPALFFISLYTLNSSLLQCRKKYFIPAVAPAAFNLIWILAIWLKPNVQFLAIAITFAFAGQWLFTAFEGARLLSFKEWLTPRLFSGEFKKLIKPLVLGIIGVGAVQFNSALDTIFARIADLKGPAFLWYAIRIQQLPIAFFGIALSGALLPPLTREADPMRKKALLYSALQSGTALMIIATFGIFALGELGINLLYGHGDFTFSDVRETTYCLWAYGLALVPSIFVLIIAAKFYSEKNYKQPMVASLVSVGANIGFNALFVFGFHLGAVSIALATALSSLINAAFLSRGEMHKEFWVFFTKMCVSCSLATIAVFTFQKVWGVFLTQDLFVQASQFAIFALLFLGISIGILSMLKLNLFKIIGLNPTKITSMLK